MKQATVRCILVGVLIGVSLDALDLTLADLALFLNISHQELSRDTRNEG